MSETQITTGTFKTTSATPLFLPIPNYINRFSLRNLTRSGVTALGVSGSLTSDRIVEAYYAPPYTTGTALIRQNGTVVGTLAPLNNGVAVINGFTVVNGASYVQGATFTISSFTPGTTTVFTTSTNHGYKVGDNVRIVNMTTAPEMGGLVMTVTATNGTNTFTTLFDSTNSLTSVGSVYKVGNAYIQNSSLYFPQNRVIAKISLANPMVVTTLVPQNYAIGDVVRFQIPTVFGMQQVVAGTNGLPLEFTVRAVNNAVGTQTVTLEADSTAYTAFAWAVAASYPYSLPMMVPQGAGNTNNLVGIVPTPLPYANQNVLSFAQQNTALNGILIGAGDGTNSATTGGILGSTTDAWEWEAVTSQQDYANYPII
tara:strand:- start:29 stop:1135 length:1107 start_codon:yes stop_codon:yes gene_type:complete